MKQSFSLGSRSIILLTILASLAGLAPHPAAAGAGEYATASSTLSTGQDGPLQPETTGQPTHGADPEPTPTTFVEAITVTTSHSPHPLRHAAGSVSLIDARQIEQRQMGDLADLLAYTPGITVDNHPEREGLGGVNIRGIGGNRVLTRIDGIATAEEFSFGPFTVPSYAIDPEALESVEVLRSAGSALYGSDALGGVLSLVTKDPADYLAAGRRHHLGLKTGWDSRNQGLLGGLTLALAGDRWQGMLQATLRDGEDISNQGTVESEDSSRTAPNPRRQQSLSLLGKLVYQPTPSSTVTLALERLEADSETRVLSAQGVNDLSRLFPPGSTFRVSAEEVLGNDHQRRQRANLSQDVTGDGLFDLLHWHAFLRSDRSEQQTVERRSTLRGGGVLGPLITVDSRRDGLMRFEQEGYGGEVRLSKHLGDRTSHLVSWGLELSRESFEQLRDRQEQNLETGEPVPDRTVYPTRYFPPTEVTEAGLYLQDEIELFDGKLLLVPGLRYDRYDLDADQNDEIYLAGNQGIEPPVDLVEDVVSPRLGLVLQLGRRLSLYAQLASGFRAPPQGAVNAGFTSLAFGVTRLPNPQLGPETSDNLELGLRGSYAHGGFSLTLFDNRFQDFIELQTLGFNPLTRLVEFQHRNVASARIQGLEVAADWRLGKRWTVHGSLALLDGEDRELGIDLESVPPTSAVVGLRWAPPAKPWQAEALLTLVAEKELSGAPPGDSGPFQPPAYELLDLTTSWAAGKRLTVQLGVFNLLDQTYWRWSDVRGQTQDSPTIDRFSGSGRSFRTTARYRW